MMDSFEAEEVIAQYRGNAIVVTAMTATGEWPQLSSTGLDLGIGGSMGMASSLGLGVALAQPTRKVIVLDADGSLLMNLSTLVTIANMAPPNLLHFVLENGVYRITGGQPIPNAGNFSFTGLAKAAGYPHAYEFDKLEGLAENIVTIMNQNGPTLVCLKVSATAPVRRASSTHSRTERLNPYSRVRNALSGSPAA